MHAAQFPGGSPWPLNQGYGHGERIFDVAFHPLTDDFLLTASEDSSVRMWRRPEGSMAYKQVRAFLGHSGEALRTCWSANGLLLASGSADRTVRLWAADLNDQGYTGRQLAVLDGHPEEVYHVELVNPTVPPPDLTALRQVIGGAGGGCSGGALPPFETHVLAASSESLFVWSLEEGAVLQQADAPGTSGSTITQEAIMAGARPAYIFGVSRQPGGSLVAAACCDGVLRLWSLRPTGRLEWAGQVALPGQPMLTGCAFAAGGSLLGVCSKEGRLIELDVRTLELLSSRQLPSSPLAIAYLPAGSGAAATGPAAAATGPGQQHEQQRGHLWLVACRDGAVYGYEPGQRGGGPCCVVRPPAGPDVAVLAVAVAPGGGAVALAGEPQDAALLPPINPPNQPSRAAPSAADGDGSQQQHNGVSASAGASGCGAQARPPPRALAARVVVAAPPRRRGGGAGRVVAGGLAAGDPLGVLDEAEGREGIGGERGGAAAAQGAGGGAGGCSADLAGGLAAMRLQDPSQQARPGPGLEMGAAAAGPNSRNGGRGEQQRRGGGGSSSSPAGEGDGEDVSMEPAAAATAEREGGAPGGGRQGAGGAAGAGGPHAADVNGGGANPSGRVRAPLFVYRGPEAGGGGW